MASCTGGARRAKGLDETKLMTLAAQLVKCIRKDQLVKAKFLLKGLSKDKRKQIVKIQFDGNAPLFIAAKQGQVNFVNYLIDNCCSDIEQRGVYEFQEDGSRHQVTPLWCAAVAGQLEVVKTLVKHNADVNAASDTDSTPVRSACLFKNIEVVKYLAENGADINLPNINGGTCLMNSVESVYLCRYLIEKSAAINVQDHSGNLALHHAIRKGREATVKLLVENGSDPYRKNDSGDDAIHTASIRGYTDILEYLICKIKPETERQIEAYQLLGTNFVDEKQDIFSALNMWRHALELRAKENVDLPANLSNIEPKEAYQHAKEIETLQELEELNATKLDEIYMQSLLIRERILGPDHKDTIFGLMYRGAIYADTHRYQRCVELWKYALQIRHSKQEALNHECLVTMQVLCKLFWEIYEKHDKGATKEEPRFLDVHQVLIMATREVDSARVLMKQRPLQLQQEDFRVLLLLLVHLIHLLSKMQLDAEQLEGAKRTIHSILQMDARDQQGRDILQLAVDKKSSVVVQEFYSKLPDAAMVQMLVDCGADINTIDQGPFSISVLRQELEPSKAGYENPNFQ